MSETFPRTRPAVEGWFRSDPSDPALLGGRCDGCATIVFPATKTYCPNPACDSESFSEVELSRTGRIWSYTTNHYAPPPPYISPEPFAPYTVAAVELAAEGIVVLGQVQGADASELQVGDAVELVIDTLFTDDDGIDVLVWKWRPVATVSTQEA